MSIGDDGESERRKAGLGAYRLPGMSDEPGMDRPLLNAGIEPMTLRIFHRDVVVEFNMLL